MDIEYLIFFIPNVCSGDKKRDSLEKEPFLTSAFDNILYWSDQPSDWQIWKCQWMPLREISIVQQQHLQKKLMLLLINIDFGFKRDYPGDLSMNIYWNNPAACSDRICSQGDYSPH